MTEKYKNVYFITGNAYAGKSTTVHLLAQKYDGIECGENYHNSLLDGLNKDEFPCLTYTRDLQDWHDFVRRSPQEYADWIAGAAKECEILELQILNDLCEKNPEKKIFVDTNICVETLHQIAEKNHVLIMLAPPETSVSVFLNALTKKSSLFISF